MKQWLSAVVPLAAGFVLLNAGRKRLLSGDGTKKRSLNQVDAMIFTLDETNLRDRFEALAPEFRLTRAGAGRPRWATDSEIEAFRSMGLVVWATEPHIAAGRLDVCRLTERGKRVQEHLMKQGGGS